MKDREFVIHQRSFDQMGLPKTRGGVTVAVIHDGHKWAIGVSACDNTDSFNRQFGYRTAKRRALAALKNNSMLGTPKNLSKANARLFSIAVGRLPEIYREKLTELLITKLFQLAKKESENVI